MQTYHCVVNKSRRLGRDDRPEDLVEADISFAPGTEGEKRLLRKDAAWQLEKMFQCAEEQGIILAGVSGFRSYDRQEVIYKKSLNERGKEHTEKYIAPPGASEHQLGLALDLSCEEINYELEQMFEQTRAGIWIRQNASLFGYVLRYPKGKEAITGYSYEPWHVRYVTKPLAYYLDRTGLVLEEYAGIVSGCRSGSFTG